jgi:hypothetical protein
MAGIDTSNILQPGSIAVEGGVTRAIISDLQLLTPQYWDKYVEKYGSEAQDYFFQFMQTFGGVEYVKNREFFWFENRGKLAIGVSPSADVSAAVAGGSITVTLAAGDHYNSGTQSPLRVGETVRVASTNVEGEILSIDDTTPSAFTFVIRPKKSTQTMASAGGTSLLSTDVLLFGGLTDVGEASDSRDPLVHLDEKLTNTTTEIRESWAATDRAEMTEIFYNSGVSGSAPAQQAGTSFFTLKGLKKANQRFLNNKENKLMRGDTLTNTGMNSSTSVGTQGFISQIAEDGEEVTYTAGSLDIAKLHEITRIMDVNGCAKENLWLQDIFQRQDFSDGIFAQVPAGAWVWGQSEKSQEAAIAYGVQSIMIDGYLLKVKKYKYFNSEVSVGKTPVTDYFRNYGIICPQGSVADAKDSTKVYKNVQIIMEQPPAGGTIGNGIRVWQHGGGSRNPTNGKMEDKVEMICYAGVRVAGRNQFLIVNG